MADEKKLACAKAVFGTFCQMLDHNDWKYKTDEEAMKISCGARGEDLPMDITVHVDADRQLTMVFSHLPLVVPEDKRLDVAIAVSTVNNVLVAGFFDYDVKSGHMFFRMTNSFMDTEVGEDACAYMIYCSCQTIDEYNDKFLMLSKGLISIEQFLAAENK